MDLPAIEDLDAMCELIGGKGARFDALQISDKIRIIELVNQSDIATMLNLIDDKLGDLAVNIGIQVAETIAENSRTIEKVVDAIDGIDTSLTHVGRWFELSRLYEPR